MWHFLRQKFKRTKRKWLFECSMCPESNLCAFPCILISFRFSGSNLGFHLNVIHCDSLMEKRGKNNAKCNKHMTPLQAHASSPSKMLPKALCLCSFVGHENLSARLHLEMTAVTLYADRCDTGQLLHNRVLWCYLRRFVCLWWTISQCINT